MLFKETVCLMRMVIFRLNVHAAQIVVRTMKACAALWFKVHERHAVSSNLAKEKKDNCRTSVCLSITIIWFPRWRRSDNLSSLLVFPRPKDIQVDLHPTCMAMKHEPTKPPAQSFTFQGKGKIPWFPWQGLICWHISGCNTTVAMKKMLLLVIFDKLTTGWQVTRFVGFFDRYLVCAISTSGFWSRQLVF